MQTAIDVYAKLRARQDVIDEIKDLDEKADVQARVVAFGQAEGFNISIADVAAAMGDLPNIISAAANDDTLTDEELELVSAGAVTSCEDT